MPKPITQIRRYGVAPAPHPAEVLGTQLISRQRPLPQRRAQTLLKPVQTKGVASVVVSSPVTETSSGAGIVIASSLPAALTAGGTGLPGTSGQAADAAHVHPMPATFPVDVQVGGADIATRATLNFAAGATVVDNPANSRVDITFAAGGVNYVTSLPAANSSNAGQLYRLSGQATSPLFSAAVLANANLKNYWRQNDPSGTVMTDNGPAARNGAYQTIQYQQSPIVMGDTSSFSTSPNASGYVGSVVSGSSDFIGGSFTIGGWVQFSAAPVSTPVLFGVDYTGGTGQQFFVQATGGAFVGTYNAGSGNTITSGFTYALNTPYFLAEVYDAAAGKISFFVNGNLVGTAATTSGTFTGSGLAFYMGGSARNTSFGSSNRISEVCTFNAALSAANLLALYQDGVAYADDRLYMSIQLANGSYAMKQLF